MIAPELRRDFLRRCPIHPHPNELRRIDLHSYVYHYAKRLRAAGVDLPTIDRKRIPVDVAALNALVKERS